MRALDGYRTWWSGALLSCCRHFGSRPIAFRRSLLDLGHHRLRDLSEPEHVFQLVHPSLPSDFPPLRSLDVYPGNLPIQPSSFVGRNDLLVEAAKALTERRIVTFTGVGGVGKTRAALQVAAEIVPKFRDGAWLTELASVGTIDSFEDAVATSLRVRPRPGTPLGQCVTEFLRDKQVLLILDNCEHLLDAVAAFVEDAIGHPRSSRFSLRVVRVCRSPANEFSPSLP